MTCKPSIMMQFRQMSLSATSSSQVYRSFFFFLGLFRILLYCNYFNSSILTSKWGGIFIFPGKKKKKKMRKMIHPVASIQIIFLNLRKLLIVLIMALLFNQW
ncbi:hypothetical protein OUZ56_014420 [Daphnia magna]|uniref:Uncharacterized protein n=1 Tax=Daphnia magna TaxID=35525 RepID=A0ABR0AJQ2_9CRUS|nr:hypothetical protein OUZ56_014420 [Daphnia magna]